MASVGLALLVLLLWPTWVTLPATWLADRSHGFAVAAYCVWRLWTFRGRLVPSGDRLVLGLVLSAAVGGVWLASIVIGVEVGHQLMAIAILLAWSLAVYGSNGMRELWPLAAIAALAIPVWEAIVGTLQAMTVAVNHALILATGIPAELDGRFIRFPFGTIEVAQSCAGLAFFMSGLSISTIYAFHYLRHPRARTAAIGLAVGLSLVSNWIRVFGLVAIGYRSRMQSSLMEDHEFYGWVIFACFIAVYFLFTGPIERWEQRLMRSAESTLGVLTDERRMYLDARAPTIRPILAATATAALPLLLYSASSLRPVSLTLSTFVPGLAPPADWELKLEAVRDTNAKVSSTSIDSGAARLAPPWSPIMMGPQHRQVGTIRPTDITLPLLRVDRFGYEGNTRGSELIGQGNAIATGEALLSDELVGPLDQQLRTVRQAIVRDGTGARLVWYWYRVAGVETPSPARAKLLELVAFVHRTSPSELVAVSAPCDGGNCQRALDAVHTAVLGRALSVGGTR